jgi:death on curing protein
MRTNGLATPAMEVFLVLNGYEVHAPVDDQERLMLAVASGALDRERLASWLNQHVAKLQ